MFLANLVCRAFWSSGWFVLTLPSESSRAALVLRMEPVAGELDLIGDSAR